MKDNLDKAKQRAFRYWYVDGLSEMVLSFICLLLGGYFWLQTHLPSNFWLSQMLIIFLVLFILTSGFLLKKAVTAIKYRLTYPRTGYVAYPQPRKRQNWLAVLLGMSIGFLSVMIFNRLPGSTTWIPAITGIVFAIVMLVIGLRLELIRF